jgi:WD40 repeat protein
MKLRSGYSGFSFLIHTEPSSESRACSDLRSPKQPLYVYNEAHSDDVSALSFHPNHDHLLLSGAVDGLTSTIDVRIAEEDDAILHTANVGASLSRVGWTNLPGRSGENAWQGTFALTNMETLNVYDANDEVRSE